MANLYHTIQDPEKLSRILRGEEEPPDEDIIFIPKNKKRNKTVVDSPSKDSNSLVSMVESSDGTSWSSLAESFSVDNSSDGDADEGNDEDDVAFIEKTYETLSDVMNKICADNTLMRFKIMKGEEEIFKLKQIVLSKYYSDDVSKGDSIKLDQLIQDMEVLKRGNKGNTHLHRQIIQLRSMLLSVIDSKIKKLKDELNIRKLITDEVRRQLSSRNI